MGRDEETNNIQWGPNLLEQEAEKYTSRNLMLIGIVFINLG